jgi:hypothetical protein
MIGLWLISLAVVYILVAIVVGKVCAINSRWERTVDRIDPLESDAASPAGGGAPTPIPGETPRP